jgi:signal transduction histidine kinase/CheY-like chemotaxis protein/HPt (histidine-containing phosphotransfer) domain-containing protein
MDNHLFETIPNPIIHYNSAWNITHANQAAVDALGFTDMKELINRNIFSFIHPKDHYHLKHIHKQLLRNTDSASGLKLSHTKITKEAPSGLFLSQFTKIDHPSSGEHASYIESAFQIEETDDLSDQIRLDLKKTTILSENIHGLEVFLIDEDHNVHYKLGRESFQQGWHKQLHDAINFWEYFNPEVIPVLKPLLTIAFEQTPVIKEFSFKEEYFSIRFIPSDLSSTKRLCVVILQNITETKLIEKKLKVSTRQAEEANHAKDDFVAKMSHEIRTPLNAITGFTEQLEKTRLTNKQANYTHIISNASRHLLSVINGILELSKNESGQNKNELIPFKIGTILQDIDDVLKIKYKQKNLEFKIICESATEEFLLGEPSKLRQILINLANNAIKFTHKGSISIACRCIKNTDNQKTLRFEVTDTGIGIDTEERKKIFKPFHQVNIPKGKKNGGSGLGLTISKDLIESMGSTIELDSTPGKGSTFKFALSFKKAGNSDIKAYEKQTLRIQLPLDKLRVLFVDDDPVNLLLGKLILDKYKVKADFSNSGSDALKKFRTDRYDIIFLDINMSDYNGMEITKHIREEEKRLRDKQKTRIIVMTANAMRKQIETYMQAGIDSIIIKPYREETLYQKLVAFAAHVDTDFISFESKPVRGKTTEFDLKNLLDYTQGDSEYTILMLDTFIKSARFSLKKIKSAYKANDYNAIAEAAHKLIPSVEQLGLKTSSRLLKRVEKRYFKKETYRKDSSLIESTIDELQKGIKTIKRFKLKSSNKLLK